MQSNLMTEKIDSNVPVPCEQCLNKICSKLVSSLLELDLTLCGLNFPKSILAPEQKYTACRRVGIVTHVPIVIVLRPGQGRK